MPVVDWIVVIVTIGFWVALVPACGDRDRAESSWIGGEPRVMTRFVGIISEWLFVTQEQLDWEVYRNSEELVYKEDENLTVWLRRTWLQEFGSGRIREAELLFVSDDMYWSHEGESVSDWLFVTPQKPLETRKS